MTKMPSGTESTEVETTLDAVRLAPGIASGTHVYESSEDAVPFVPSGQLYVEFSPQAGVPI